MNIENRYEGQDPTHDENAIIARAGNGGFGGWTKNVDEEQSTVEYLAKVASADFTIGEIPLNRLVDPVTGVKVNMPNRKALYREDLEIPLDVVGINYKPHQPRDVTAMWSKVADEFGLEIESVGSMKEGRVITVCARFPDEFAIGNDRVGLRALFCTPNDGSGASKMAYISNAYACHNQLAGAMRSAVIKLSHRHEFDSAVFTESGFFDCEDFKEFEEDVRRMAGVKLTDKIVADVIMGAYHNRVKPEDVPGNRTVELTFERLARAFHNAPGQQLDARKDTLWGVVNAVTYDIDHQRRTRTSTGHEVEQQMKRQESALLGSGAAIKQRAWATAKTLLGDLLKKPSNLPEPASDLDNLLAQPAAI